MADPIELAHEPSFALGRVTVFPAERELVRDDGQREVLEHRVMQVLIALSKSDGAILTREELMARCWRGRVVGEDALNRVMSRLRKAAEGIGAKSFSVETITKVGYRLLENDPVQSRPPSARKAVKAIVPRRAMLMGGGAAALAGAAGLAVAVRGRGSSESAETKALLAQAWTAWTQGTDEGNSQAIGLYRRLLDAAPRSADGWGLLACAYADRAQYWTRPSRRELVRARAHSAGQRALDLDPRNAYGRVAIAYARPFRGNWLFMEREFRRASADQPSKTLGTYSVAFLLGLVGRFSEAVPLFEQIRHVAPTVNQFRYQIEALWGSGRLDEAERLTDEAMSIYAANPSIWRTRFNLHLLGGRARAAIAMVQDVDARPAEPPQERYDDLMRLAVALDTRASSAISSLVDHETRRGRTSANEARTAIQNLSAIGRADEAFAYADAYFFSRGFVIPDGPSDVQAQNGASLRERQPDFLFQPFTQALRENAQFGKLTRDLGLDDYWREANARPDYQQFAARGAAAPVG